MKNVLISIVFGLGMLSHANAFDGDAAAGKTKAATCAGCHGANGIGIADNYPNLAGQHADYIVKQLKAFQAGSRKDPVMAPMAAALSEQDMQDVAAHFSSFGRDGSAPAGAASADESASATPAAAAPAAVVADASAGKALYEHGDKERGITACVDCHGKDGNSKVLINPNLAKQHPEYIEKQLKAFKAESRHNASMNQVAGNLTDADIANIGAYFEDTSAVGEVKASAGKVAVKSFVGDVAAGKAKAATCTACHGADGNPMVAMYPALAGQGEAYLIKQLAEFKSGQRDNAVMAGMAAPLSDDDIKNVAAYFASQTLKPAAAKTSNTGQKLYVSGDAKRGIPACIACHGINGDGMDKAAFPSIAGQSATYIKSQLELFREAKRDNDRNAMMRNIAIKLSDDDISALANYMAAMK
ncbi:hypothetical protein tinsulaeT_16390 [Thalassotalea insulae]|uniref:Cytochrome c domain-containing protein n=1 Tax=Thalassotalea insulae TaxID=2056778 RepID=A0ABQ6GRQ1_9GAMM|nr:c-type cytochrome [Thalassotalea insulae]GLX78299.1 hypothetical protein tinsulaeT_16390 [Thalassotalea insulae]